MTDLGKWATILSPLAVKLYAEIERRGKDEMVDIGELMAVLGRRRTPIFAALNELEEHGLINLSEV